MNETRQLVLLLDDDENVLRSLSRLLKSAGFEVEAYSTPNEFLGRAAPECPACAILDFSMPGMNGVEVQEELARRDWHCGVVFLSGEASIPASVRAMKLGAVDFLTKPADEDHLIRAIREALERQQQAFELHAFQEHLKERFEPLTDRERQVMELVVDGNLNKQIAFELGIAEKTVKAHRAKVMEKTGARSLAKLVQLHMALQRSEGGE